MSEPEDIRAIEKWLPSENESTARRKLRELAADRDQGWHQHNQAEIGRLNAEVVLRKADKAASRAHDAMWAMDFDKTSAGQLERDEWKRLREQASKAIWALHNAVRPMLPENHTGLNEDKS